MTRGVVKRFNEKKGYGFILEEGTNADVFVHYTNIKTIKADGLRSLTEGESVEFDLIQDPKGAKALNVVSTSPSSVPTSGSIS